MNCEFSSFVSYSYINLVAFALAGYVMSNRSASLFVTLLTFASLGITVFATALIIYRIHHLSRDIDAASSKYNFTVQVLVESGALYAAALVVECVFLVLHNRGIGPQGEGTIFWVGLATPMAVSVQYSTPSNI